MAENNKNQGQGTHTQGTQGNQGQQNFGGSNKGTGTPSTFGNQGTQGQQRQGSTSTGQPGSSFGQGNQGNTFGQGNQTPGSPGTATGIAERVKETASSAKEAATGFLHSAAEQAGHASTGVASGMHSLAGSIRERLPSEGMLGSAASSVAQGLDSGGRYLEEEGFSGMMEDMSGMIRRNPVTCMCVCLGLGFIVGRLLTSSNHSGSY
jgi:hypothetical protein